jgi:tRNA-Thr(GGU) m(6)t(6)A37 methyltransferase TsaA
MTDLSIIARVHTDFPEKFGLPRQSGVVPELTGTVVFEEEYRNPDALRGIEGFSHLWLLWGFSEGFSSRGESEAGSWSPTVRPPRLGGNTRMGVFATRSPNRPNPIGLSVVRLIAVERDPACGPVLKVAGIDMTDGTPVYDIKPYLPFADAVPDAVGGYADALDGDLLAVEDPENLLARLPAEKRGPLVSVLRGDPRPSYRRTSVEEADREYGFPYAGYEITFRVCGDTLTLCGIEKK